MADQERLFRIGEMAEFFGVSTDTLRIYDRRELIPTARNDGNRYRVYNREDLIFLDYIMRLRKLGMPLRDVKELVDGGTLEQALDNMLRQRERLEETLLSTCNKLTLVQDYIEGFSLTLEHMGKISVTTSDPILYKNVGQDMTAALGAFARLTEAHVPRLTFVISRELVDFSPASHTAEHFNEMKPHFRNALTLVDDEGFHERPNFPADEFTCYLPRKCLRTSIRAVTNHDYSEYFRFLDYIRDGGYELDGDILLRSVSFRYCDVAYYDVWAPIR